MDRHANPSSAARILRAALEEEAAISPVYRFVLAYGKDFVPVVRPAGVELGEKHYCYRNAFRLALSRPDLRYVDGFGLSAGWTSFPAGHAWCVDADECVVDPTPTWADPGSPLPDSLLGVELPLEVARPHVEQEEPTRGTLDAYSRRMDELTAALGLPPV